MKERKQLRDNIK